MADSPFVTISNFCAFFCWVAGLCLLVLSWMVGWMVGGTTMWDQAQKRTLDDAWSSTCTLSTHGLLSKRLLSADVDVNLGTAKYPNQRTLEITFCPVDIHYTSDEWHPAGTVEAEVFAGFSFHHKDPNSWCASLLASQAWPNIRIFAKGHQQPPPSEMNRLGWGCGDFGRLQCIGSRDNCTFSFGEGEPMSFKHRYMLTQPAINTPFHSCVEPLQATTSSTACTVDNRGQISLGAKAELEKQLDHDIAAKRAIYSFFRSLHWAFWAVSACCFFASEAALRAKTGGPSLDRRAVADKLVGPADYVRIDAS